MTRVTAKYQITIPPQVRKSLKIIPGTKVDLVRQGDQFVLVADPLERLKKDRLQNTVFVMNCWKIKA